MADHTELVLGVRIEDGPETRAGLEWMIGKEPHREREESPVTDGHRLWTLPSARWMLRGGRGLRTSGVGPYLNEVDTSDVEDTELERIVWISFVDREAQSVAFLDWLGPRVSPGAHRREQVIGWLMWQGAGELIPDLIFYDPDDRRIYVSSVAKARGFRF